MYKAKLQGSTADSRGNLYRFSPGSLIDAPKGSLDHCTDVEWVEEKPVKQEANIDVKAELDKSLDETIKSVKPKRGRKKKNA